jgi:hypothetical protein
MKDFISCNRAGHVACLWLTAILELAGEHCFHTCAAVVSFICWLLTVLHSSGAPAGGLYDHCLFCYILLPQSRSRPVTDLMTRSNAQEIAAFAADPGNDAIYKAMINEWK